MSHLRLVLGGRTTPAGHAAPTVKPQVALESVPGTNTAEWEARARKVILAQPLGDTGLTAAQAVAEINRLYLSGRADDLHRVGCLMTSFNDVGLHVSPADPDLGLATHVYLTVFRPKALQKSFSELKLYQQYIKPGMMLG